jgi:transcriptional repressor NrdR
LRCPFCGELESQVKDSRPSEDGSAIRRRRLCPQCGGRFTTFERVQLRELIILKRSGRRAPFDREKLVRSITVATRKRPVDPERIERMVNAIVRQLESLGETELPSHVVGEMVMKALKALDDVAYVRYASVYRDFRQTEDFAHFLNEEGLGEDSLESEDRGHDPNPGRAA